MKLVEEAGLTHLHVFPYSERPGTPAEKMPQIPVSQRKERAKILRELGTKKHLQLLERMVGKTLPVLIENNGMGWTENYLHVIVEEKYPIGEIILVKIKGVKDNALVG